MLAPRLTRSQTSSSLSHLLALAVAAIAIGLFATPAYGAPDDGAPATDWRQGFEAAAQSVQESVVAITAAQAPPDDAGPTALRELPRRMAAPFADRMRGFFENDFLERFFFDRPARGASAAGQALGSGVIVDDRGHVLTNEHVVAGAGTLTVWLADGRSVKASVVGTDPGTDLAVLRIDAEARDLRPARLANSDALKVGQWVMAVGRPAGSDIAVTAGVVSARGRSPRAGSVQYEDLIRTDAAIGPTQSVGPLVNLGGEVVGIATAVRSRSAGNPALGVAIPSNKARQVLDRLVSESRVARGWLGVGVQELDDGLASSFGYDRSGGSGILVGDVAPDGPAARAGLKSGDIIVRLGGKDAGDLRTCSERVAGLKPGAKVPVEVWREGGTQTLQVEVGEAPAAAEARLAGARQTASAAELPKPDAFGLTLADATPELRRQAGVGDDVAGAFITAVVPGSLAAALDLRPGDLVLEVQGRAVRNAAEARAEVSKLDPAEGMRLRVRRGDVTRFVFLKLSA